MEKLIIIGGVAAGMSAAAKAARVNPRLSIEVFTAEEHISYGACGLPYYIAGEIQSQDRLVARTVEQFQAQNINVHINHEVIKINPEEKQLIMKNLTQGSIITKNYDKLVIATGASPFIPKVEGVELKNVFILRNMEQGIELRQYVENKKPRSAVIVGGGYIGLEMAETFQKIGAKVHIVERASQIVPNMDENMALLIQNYLLEQGVSVYTGEQLTKISGNTEVSEVITDKRKISCDCVLIAVGTIPNSKIAAEAGMELGIKNAIKVNTRMETNIPGIYSAGDCATVRHLLTNEDVYIPLGTTANKQGKTAGENAAGGSSEFKGVLGTGIAKVIGLEIARTGLSSREAESRGLQYIDTVVESRTAAHYYPDSSKISISLCAEVSSGKLLGGQIVGGRGAGKRIDVIAAGLHLGARVEDLLDMDLAYAPPFSPVYDPILTALTDLQKKLNSERNKKSKYLFTIRNCDKIN